MDNGTDVAEDDHLDLLHALRPERLHGWAFERIKGQLSTADLCWLPLHPLMTQAVADGSSRHGDHFPRVLGPIHPALRQANSCLPLREGVEAVGELMLAGAAHHERACRLNCGSVLVGNAGQAGH